MHLKKRSRYLLAGLMATLAVLALPALASAYPLSASTLAATGVGPKTATLNGEVDTGTEPKSQIVYGFQYGTTTAYGSETEGVVGQTGSGVVGVHQSVSGLKASTTYHYRLVVLGEGKYTYGKDMTFTTQPLQPVGVFVTGGKIGAESYPVALTGTQAAENPVTLTVNSRTVKCSTTQFKTELAAASSSLSLSSVYGDCTGFGLPTTISMNSCTWVLNVGSSSNNWGVACSKEGDAIVMDVYGGTCTVTIAAQVPAGEVGLANQGEGQERRIAASLLVKGLKVNVKGGLLACGASGLRDATLSGWATFKGLETP